MTSAPQPPRAIEFLEPRTHCSAAAPAANPHDVQTSGPPPQPPPVEAAYVRGSDWERAGFGQVLESAGLGHRLYGFRADAAAPDATLPWTNINQIVLRYAYAPTSASRPTPDRVTATGVRADYEVTAVDAVGSDGRTFVLTLDRPLGFKDDLSLRDPTEGDRILLTAPGRTAPNSQPPYTLTLNSLQGDADQQNHRVTALDSAYIRARYNRTATEDPPPGLQPYDPFADVNASGRINAIDLAFVRARRNDSLPPAPAPAPALVSANAFGGTRIRAPERSGLARLLV